MILNSKDEMLIYNKYIKPYVKEEDGSLVLDANVFARTYMSIKSEKIQTVYVNCLNKTNIKLVNRANVSNYSNQVELTEEEDFIDDYSSIDEYIEQEIISQYYCNEINDDYESDNSFYLNNQFIDSLVCTNYDKQYIKGYIDGRNFELTRAESYNKSKDRILYTESISDKIKKQQLRDKLLEILEILNDLEKEVIWLSFSENLSFEQIAVFLNITEKAVAVIYKKALMKIKNNQYIEELKKYVK